MTRGGYSPPVLVRKWQGNIPGYVLGVGYSQKALVEHVLKDGAIKAGFELSDVRDNKSVVSRVALFDSLSNYYHRPTSYDDAVLDEAIKLAYAAFASEDHPLTPLPEDLEVISKSLKLSKSSGAPMFLTKREALQTEWRRYLAFWRPNHRKTIVPCVAYHRVQHGDAGPKTRLVWGYPLMWTIAEARFARPLIERFLRSSTPYCFGKWRCELASKAIPITNSNVRVGLDVSKFDASVPPKLIKVAFKILLTWFGPLSEHDKMVYDYIVSYFINTPIIMPDGNVWQKSTGVPSGSYFTQMVDSIVNFIMVQYIRLRDTGRHVSFQRILVLGDDSLTTWPVKPNLLKLEAYASELGFKINTKKSEVTTFGQPFHFLGHTWSHGLPDRPVSELVKHAVYPERRTDGLSGDVRRRTRVISFAGDAKSGTELFNIFYPLDNPGGSAYLAYKDSFGGDPEAISTGWLQGQRSQNVEVETLSSADYLATSLLK